MALQVLSEPEQRYDELKRLMSDLPDVKVYAGAKAIDEIVEAGPINIVLTAMVGFAGLSPTIHAIKAHKAIALANKETLVVAGELIRDLASEYHAPILPVDSEHSAIFQSLVGEDNNPIEKILLTASGGPFRNFTMEQIAKVTKDDALRHPTWDMGAKITIDSASMMNKGFEVIEAKWLFGVKASQIQVLVHPQSIVHSAVQFQDGARPSGPLCHPASRLLRARPQEVPLSGTGFRVYSEGGQHALHCQCSQRDCESRIPRGQVRIPADERHHCRDHAALHFLCYARLRHLHCYRRRGSSHRHGADEVKNEK